MEIVIGSAKTVIEKGGKMREKRGRVINRVDR